MLFNMNRNTLFVPNMDRNLRPINALGLAL